MAKRDLTAQVVRSALQYNAETGVFIWNHRLSSAGRAVKCCGKKAGCLDAQGRLVIRIKPYLYFAHQLAWLHHYGKWPEHVIDHINGNPSDNRIANLRDIPQAINMQNRRKVSAANSLPLLGAHKVKGCKRVRARCGSTYLGMFSTPEEAHAAYVEAKRRMHPGCTL